jgi:SPP1 gp7 family putative phage head morphogenesis protein
VTGRSDPNGPRSANEVLLDLTISHALLVERWKAHEVRRIVRLLDREVLPDLAARIGARLANIATRGFDSGPSTTSRLEYLFADLREFAKQLRIRLAEETGATLYTFAKNEAEVLARSIRLAAPMVSVVTPSASTIRAVAFSRPLQGKVLREWWQDQERALRDNVGRQIRIGLMQGESSEQIVRRVRDVWPAERHRIATTVRTAVNHISTQARQATFEENADLLDGVEWVATLDTRTCPACGALDGKVFPVDSGPRPPLHPLDRCTVNPVLKSAAALGLKDLDGVTRASMDGQVPEAVRFEDWLPRQSAARQNAVLGVGRATLYRAGRLDLRDMVDATGSPIPLRALLETVEL